MVDCPPSLGLLTFNALRAADEAIVPIDPSFLSIHGLGRMLEMIELIRLEGRHALSLKALLVMLDLRTRFAHEFLSHLESELKARYQTIIRQTVRLREAAACGKPVISHAPNSIGAEDFEHLAD
jgi:chromosome partitioning protein